MSTAGVTAAASVAESECIGGHPKGLWFLVFTETWERFSYYGMTALLAIYMVDQLLLPGHVEHVAGFAALRAMLGSASGNVSTAALAAQVVGLYSGLVYFTPLFGGLIADRWIGQRNAVVLGALSMTAGHIAMTFDQSFLLALVLLIVGSGLLKGNISAQVGALYPVDDEARRNRGYVLFSTGINVGAVVGPLLCGLLAQVYGWHYGFGAAALLMILGLATYLYGFRYLPARAGRTDRDTTKLTVADWKVIAALTAVTAITVFQSIAWYQSLDVLMLWIKERVQLVVFGFHVPVPWFASVNALASIVAVPLLFWIWKWQAAHGGEPHEMGKIETGAWIIAVCHLLLVAASLLYGTVLVNILWAFFATAGLGVGFVYYWPTLLSLVSRTAPPRMKSTMMGVAFISLFVAGTAMGWLGGFYEKMGPAAFWALHAALAAVGGLLMMVLGGRLNRALPSE
jgi:POT family proton-dependent oligopeptide transporter